MDLKRQVLAFLAEFQMPRTKFCQKIGISATSLYRWLHGDLKLSAETIGRIEEFLSRYIQVLSESA